MKVIMSSISAVNESKICSWCRDGNCSTCDRYECPCNGLEHDTVAGVLVVSIFAVVLLALALISALITMPSVMMAYHVIYSAFQR